MTAASSTKASVTDEGYEDPKQQASLLRRVQANNSVSFATLRTPFGADELQSDSDNESIYCDAEEEFPVISATINPADELKYLPALAPDRSAIPPSTTSSGTQAVSPPLWSSRQARELEQSSTSYSGSRYDDSSAVQHTHSPASLSPFPRLGQSSLADDSNFASLNMGYFSPIPSPSPNTRNSYGLGTTTQAPTPHDKRTLGSSLISKYLSKWDNFLVKKLSTSRQNQSGNSTSRSRFSSGLTSKFASTFVSKVDSVKQSMASVRDKVIARFPGISEKYSKAQTWASKRLTPSSSSYGRSILGNRTGSRISRWKTRGKRMIGISKGEDQEERPDYEAGFLGLTSHTFFRPDNHPDYC